MAFQKVRRGFRPSSIARTVLGPSAISLFVLTLTVTASGAGAQSGKPSDYGRIAFTIPSQPLGAALETYARISSQEGLYDGKLAIGRRSSLVDGIYTPEVALQILLAGTGLLADFKDAGFFIVGSAPAARVVRGRRSAEDGRYYGLLQASLRIAFCGSNVLPGGNRVAARLWIGQRGDVLQVKNLGSSGSGELDQKLNAVLLGLEVGVPPPEGFEQPITIVIMPGDTTQDCDNSRQSPVKAGP